MHTTPMQPVPTESLPAASRGRPPGPPDRELARHTLDMLRDPLHFLLRGRAEHGPISAWRFGPQRYWLVNEPSAVRRVLVENARAYVKSPNYVGLRIVLGDGLVTSEGELWKRQRRLASPAFHPRSIDAFVPVFVRHTERMLDRWQARDGATLDAHREMMSLTLSIVGECLFEADLDGATDRLGTAIETVLHFANDYALAWPRLPLWLPTPRRREFHRALGELDVAVAQLIGDRRARIAAGGPPGTDLLGSFLSARDEDGTSMSDRQLRDEVLTMLGAGHETTANALSFTLHVLSKHPATARDVRREVESVVGQGAITAAHLPRLALTERVIKESMRLHPPVWMIERANGEPDVLGGYAVPPGTVIGISPWVLHRDETYWENPEGFDPDRFLPEAEAARPRYVYLPFGAGPRVCIGAGFAMTEAKTLLASIVRRAHLSAVPGRELVLDPNLTLRPKGALPMALSMRRTAAAA